MTKPAAVFLQLLGFFFIVPGFFGLFNPDAGFGTFLIFGLGVGFLFWGGIETRKRIRVGRGDS